MSELDAGKIASDAGAQWEPGPEGTGLVQLMQAFPLGEELAEAVGERVTLHIIGGMQVHGKLLAYNEQTGVATVRSGEDLCRVPATAVAVLSSKD
jgi:hypothetical protein